MIGGTVAAGIWTGTFRDALVKHLPEGTDVDSIYADLRVQLSYPMGSPERTVINKAYADAQRLMLDWWSGAPGRSSGLCSHVEGLESEEED